jgi:large subunit ribosomal protein L15
LQKLDADTIDLAVLKKAGLAHIAAINAKVILAGTIERKVVLQGLGVSKGARAAVEKAGGSVEAPVVTEPPKKLPPKAKAQAQA